MFANNPKKEIRVLQKVIDKVNKGIEGIAKCEKYCLDEAAKRFEEASKYEGKYKSTHLRRKERAEEEANYHASMRLFLQKELAYVERLKQKQIEALQDADFITAQKTRLFCFFF